MNQLTLDSLNQWLVKKGKEKEARDILVKYHANGKEDDELVEYEFQEIVVALSEEEANSQTKYTDYLKGPGNRRRLLIIIVVSLGTNWVGNGIIGYYLAPILRTLGIDSTDQQLQILIGLQVWNCGFTSLAFVLGEKIPANILC